MNNYHFNTITNPALKVQGFVFYEISFLNTVSSSVASHTFLLKSSSNDCIKIISTGIYFPSTFVITF